MIGLLKTIAEVTGGGKPDLLRDSDSTWSVGLVAVAMTG